MSGGEVAVHVVETAALDRGEIDAVVALFAAGYRDADEEYLRAALHHLRLIALAHDGGTLAGFALADNRRLALPRLATPRVVRLAGLACVAPAYRRRHLMVAMTGLAMRHDLADDPGLACGRMAHPATHRLMAHLPGAVPRVGAVPTAWEREIGQAIATAYGVQAFDPETFVCRGRGRPIGYPRIDIEATPDEWALFRHVDRARGDSLLGFAWLMRGGVMSGE